MISKETVKRFSDERGFVFEPLSGEVLAGQKNVHVVTSRPGAVRGNHYHLKGTETLVVCGPALVRIRTADQLEDFSIPADTTCRVIIPPGVSHAVKNTGATDMLLVAFNTEPHYADRPDWIADILIPT
jgi:UDP-2-acetamido-2,6-beta-L-arabino-hexul-4-ose reductase